MEEPYGFHFLNSLPNMPKSFTEFVKVNFYDVLHWMARNVTSIFAIKHLYCVYCNEHIALTETETNVI